MVAVMVVSSVVVSQAAAASTGTDDVVTVDEAAAALADVAAVTGPSAPSIVTPDGFTAAAAGSVVELPSDPSDGLSLTSADGASIKIGLPGASNADDGVQQASGQIVYADALPDVALAAQPTQDGGVRALVVIDGPQAPAEFRFPMTVPSGTSLVPSSDGGVSVVGFEGPLVAQITPPWAYDANGTAVPSSCRVEGTTLIQTVSHAGAVYPVVADPRLSYGTYNGIYTGLSNLCRSSKWTCKTVDITVESVRSGWRNSSCASTGLGVVVSWPAGIESCTWEREVTLRVRLYGYRSSSKGLVLLNNNIWGPSYLIEKTYGGCAIVCWGAPEPRESLGAKGWTFSENWW